MASFTLPPSTASFWRRASISASVAASMRQAASPSASNKSCAAPATLCSTAPETPAARTYLLDTVVLALPLAGVATVAILSADTDDEVAVAVADDRILGAGELRHRATSSG